VGAAVQPDVMLNDEKVGHVYGKIVDGSVGLEEIKDCKYIGQENP
jgi:hypothetical protein